MHHGDFAIRKRLGVKLARIERIGKLRPERQAFDQPPTATPLSLMRSYADTELKPFRKSTMNRTCILGVRQRLRYIRSRNTKSKPEQTNGCRKAKSPDMRIPIILYAAVFLLAGCDRGTTIRKAEPELAAKLPLVIRSKGVSYLSERNIDAEDVSVTLTNGTAKSIFVPCSQPKYHSNYIIERNPNAICYQTSGDKGSAHLLSRGLSGGGPIMELPPGQSITFVAPIPILPTDPPDGRLRITVTVYLDRNRHEARIVYSGLVSHNQGK